jgi:branched-chain amino acid aminotransferase
VIWVAGRIVRDDEFTISVLDRTFEHGLGLFETLRTWNGEAVLLAQHVERLCASANALGLPLDPSGLPDDDAVDALLHAEHAEGDVVLRITLSGGTSEAGSARTWMRALPLPPALRHGGAVVTIGDGSAQRDSRLARHKTLNYWERRLAYEAAQQRGYDESISAAPNGTLWEGSRTNLFLVEGDSLVTPAESGPIVPGVMRRTVIALAAERLPLAVREEDHGLTATQLFEAEEVFLTNSVRGIIPVASAHHHRAWPDATRRWPAPGRWTQRLSLLLADRLNPEGDAPA